MLQDATIGKPAVRNRHIAPARWRPPAAAAIALVALAASACSGDAADETSQAVVDRPPVLVTTGIWADVVSNVACGDLAQVETIIPVGGDPHSYEPSLQDRARMERAALVVANGLGLEEGLADTLEAVAESGTAVFEFASGVEALPFTFESGHHDDHDDHGDHEAGHDHHDDHESDHDDHSDDSDHSEHDDHGDHGDHDEADHDDHDGHKSDHGNHDDHDDHESDQGEHDDHGDHDDHHGHDHSGGDPHIWFDPVRVAAALPDLALALETEAGLDADALAACVNSYRSELEEVNAEIVAAVAELPADRHKLVTNHDALGYFADRYGFEIIGAVLPSGSLGETNAAHLEELAQIIEHESVRAVFGETQHAADDAEALAERVGDIEVVTLYTGSLGPAGSGADTYAGFLRTNTRLIVDALGGPG